MKSTVTKIATAVAATVTIATPAFAASSHTDNVGILACSFLGFCALIIAVIPDERNPQRDEIVKELSTNDTKAETRQ